MLNAGNPVLSQGKLTPERRDALQKLLESQTFASAPRLREVLYHLVAALESGTDEQVSEQSIGHNVFGKPVGYNASEDNIVRVTIRHLRTRLEEYYQIEGRNDAWVLTIPKGKYIPLLTAADRVAPELPELSQPVAVLEPEVRFLAQSPAASPLRTVMALCLALFVGAGGGYLLKKSLTGLPRVSSGVFGQLCRVGDDLSVVVVDSNLQAYRQIFHRQVTLDEYIHRSYAKELLETNDPRVTDARQFAMGANETNVSSAIIAAALREALDGRRIAIKHPHDVSIRDFQDQKSVLLLGGPFINPWGQLFENRLNFRLLPLPSAPATSWIQNIKPQSGEASEYRPHTDGNLNVNYVRIAIVPNFENSGHVILMGATSAEALEESGAYLLSEEAVSELKTLFHAHSVTSLPALEFVMEVRGLNSVPNSHRIVGYRSLSKE
jgi:hypothetical protein